MNRKDDPVIEAVHETSVIVFYAQSRLGKKFFLIACLTGFVGQSLSVERGPSESVFPDGLILKATTLEVLPCNRLALLGFKTFLKESTCEFRNKEQTLMMLTLSYFLCCFLLLDNLDMVLFRKVLQCLDIGHVLMLHNEAHGSAGLSAAEAFVYSLRCRDRK